MEEILIQLSKNNDKSNIDKKNSWYNDLQKSIEIKEGDEILLKQGIIDTRITNNLIKIQEDTQITLDFGYYVYLYNQYDETQDPVNTMVDMYFGKYSSHVGNFNAYGKYYLMYNWNNTVFEYDANNCKLLENSITITIPNGDYTPKELAQIITAEYQKCLLLHENGYSYFLNSKPNLVTTANYAYNINNRTSELPHFIEYQAKFPFNRNLNQSFVYTTGSTEGVGEDLTSNAQDYTIGCSQMSLEYDELKQRFNLIMHKPVYNLNETPPTVSNAFVNLLTDNNNIELHGSWYNGGEILGYVMALNTKLTTQEADIINTKRALASPNNQFTLKYVSSVDDTTITKTDVILEEVEANTQFIKFNYVFNPTPKENKAMTLDLENNNLTEFWIQSKVESGLFLTGMSSNPPNFWEGLGFNIENITCPTQDGLLVDDTKFLSSISSQFMPISAFYNGGSLKTSSNQVNTIVGGVSSTEKGKPIYISSDITDTEGLDADNLTDYKQGYYLIEINSNFNSTMINDNDIRKHIIGICSKNYNQGGFITCYGNSGLVYIHKGEPLLLNNFNINILNDNLTDATDIGENHTIFLSIIKK